MVSMPVSCSTRQFGAAAEVPVRILSCHVKLFFSVFALLFLSFWPALFISYFISYPVTLYLEKDPSIQHSGSSLTLYFCLCLSIFIIVISYTVSNQDPLEGCLVFLHVVCASLPRLRPGFANSQHISSGVRACIVDILLENFFFEKFDSLMVSTPVSCSARRFGAAVEVRVRILNVM